MFATRAHWADKAFWWIAPVVVAGAAGGGVWYYLRTHHDADAAKSPAKSAKTAEKAQPAIRHPVPTDESAAPASLPALNKSDVAISAELQRVLGEKSVTAWLNPESVVRHIVVTLDNLPRQKVAVEKRPLHALSGQTVVNTQGDSMTLSEQNFARYAPLIKLTQATDTRQIAAVYFHFYPLFQQAYEDLGYPGEYFNDRLVEVIDDLLAAPEPTGPIELVQPRVFFEYADPKLEARSAGQKLLIRMGPKNAATLKAKLRELRAVVTAASSQLPAKPGVVPPAGGLHHRL